MDVGTSDVVAVSFAEDYCDIVVSYKCKLCTFLSQDKIQLTMHYRDTHLKTNNRTGDLVTAAAGVPVSLATNFDNNVDNQQPKPIVNSTFAENNTTSIVFRLFEGTGASEDPTSIFNHIEEKEIFVCSECNVVFHSKELCSDHMRRRHNIEDFSFSEVELVDSPKKAVVQQRKIKTPVKFTLEGGSIVPVKFLVSKDCHVYRCSKCSSKFESEEILQFHEESHGETGFICRVCEGSTSNLPQNPFTNCFSTWKKCTAHMWKEHKIDCQLHLCSHPSCEFKSNFAHKVREHETIHSQLCNFRCETCHKPFKQLKQLRTHEKYHQLKNSKLPPPADSRWYTTKECPICKRILSDSKCLKKHIAAVHNKLKPHTCNICNHQTARKAELKLHMRQHTGEKPFKCSTCLFTTRDHNSLRRHQLRHSDKKTYNCKLCSFKCIQSSGFKKHIIAKHPDENIGSIFVCPYCPLISVNKEFYDNHIKDHNEGRILIQDIQQIDKDSSPKKTDSHSFMNLDDSSSNSSSNPCTKRATPRYWIRDDDSVELVDTGGTTIPAQSTSLTDTGVTVSIIAT